MPESLNLGGEELSLEEAERKFAEAMAAPEPDEPLSAPAPKRRTVQPADSKPEHSKARVTHNTPSKTPRKPVKAAGVPAPKDYTEDLTGVVQLAYGALCATGNLADAGAVKTHAPGMVQAWNTAAQENATVRRGIEFLTKGGVWGAVVVTTIPLVLQVMANHGRVPMEKVAALGVKNPGMLAKETEADIVAMAEMAQAA